MDHRIQCLAELLTDFTIGGRRSNSQRVTSCTDILSALTSVASKAGCTPLQTALDYSLTASFRRNPGAVTEGKEALPLPLAVIARLERRIRAASTPNWEKAVLGGLCVMLWGGLRWGDAQRTSPNTIILDGQIIRAIS